MEILSTIIGLVLLLILAANMADVEDSVLDTIFGIWFFFELLLGGVIFILALVKVNDPTLIPVLNWLVGVFWVPFVMWYLLIGAFDD